MNEHTAEEMRDLLAGVGFGDRVVILGDDFSYPDEAYISALGGRYRQFLFNLGLAYKEGKFNCTQFTLLAVCHAAVEHAKYSPFPTKLAVGIACIVCDIGPHCVVGAFHSNGGKLYFKLYEPQPDPGSNVCLKEFPFSRVGTFVQFSLV